MVKDQFAGQPPGSSDVLDVFIDSFDDFVIVNGVLFVTGYSVQTAPDGRQTDVPQVKLRMKLGTAANAIADATSVIGAQKVRDLLGVGTKVEN